MQRIIPLVLLLSLVAVACGAVEEAADSALDTAADAVLADSEEAGDAESGDAAQTAPDDPDAGTGDSGAVDDRLPQEIEGEKVTFNPPLEGPFDTSGGITFDPATAEGVIVEDASASPLAAQYPSWPTDWTRRTVADWSEFLAGLRSSDPRDGIPPIDVPVFESVSLASEWLSRNEPGALVRINGEARFYPLSIMTAHEIVNDAFGDVPISVTYCPLCNTALAFDRRVNGEVLDFGVSGLLRNSDLVMWDRQTTSLWQQVTGESVIGEFAGAQLEPISTSIVSFEQFAEDFPDGLSLAAESARGRSAYGTNPYQGYSSSASPFLFQGSIDDRLPALSRVVGVTEGDAQAAYSFERLAAEQVINDESNGVPIVVFHGGLTTDALDQGSIAASQNIGTGIAHDPVVDGNTLTFTANGDDTFTDDQTGSTWSILGVAINGELAGTELATLEHRNEFWFAWAAFFGPDNLRES